jgi:hypothetical protein
MDCKERLALNGDEGVLAGRPACRAVPSGARYSMVRFTAVGPRYRRERKLQTRVLVA